MNYNNNETNENEECNVRPELACSELLELDVRS